jgi:membrane fusion protein (multidrug efflux system)
MAVVEADSAQRDGGRARIALMLAGPMLLLIGALAWYLLGGRYVDTDNAYLRADFVAVSPRIGGRVASVGVASDQPVRKGEVLFVLDTAELEVAVSRAEAELATARSEIESQRALLAVRRAELASARSAAAYREREAKRLEGLAGRGITSRVSYDAALEDQRAANDRVHVIERQIIELIAALDGQPEGPIDDYARVRLKAADLAEARLRLDWATVRAPADGQVGRVELFAGEELKAGEAALRIVVSARPYVEANMKETQLDQLRRGQPAEIRVDAYPDKVWTARVASISPATGAEFSLLPPENASGNWVKIVQRVPVRLELESGQSLTRLRAGMSADVRIDTGEQSRRWYRWVGGGPGASRE